jgi:hypothetical protein
MLAILLLLAGLGAIFYARGFKPNFKNGSIDRTGLIVAKSQPTGANVYLDGRLTNATDTNINYLEPKTYKIRIEKDGYTPWEKELEIKADLATEITALLFPLAPEIKPLTITGATSPTLSPDGSKIAYGVSGERGGLFVIPMDNNPLPFRQSNRLIAKNSPGVDYSKSRFIWSPESKELIARFEDENGNATANLLVDSDKGSSQVANDVTASLTSTLNTWQQTIDERAQTAGIAAPDQVKEATKTAKIVNSSPLVVNSQKTPITKKTTSEKPQPVNLNYFPTGLMFSPDEDKILYKTADKYKVYDLKLKKEFTLPDFADLKNISWFPDSKHLVIAQNNLISIIETDGYNKLTVFSGKFENGFVFAHPTATRLIILTTLAQPENSTPNLYAINLR